MKLSMETYALRESFDDETAIRMLKNAGFDAIDYSMYGFKDDKDILQEDYYHRALKLKGLLEEENMVCNQAHAPFELNFDDSLDMSNNKYCRLIRSIEVAAVLGAENIVVHAIRDRKPKDVDFKEYNKRFYEGLIPYCEKFKICVSVENLFLRAEYDNEIFFSTFKNAKEHNEFVKEIDSPWINACVDTGHCSLTGFNPAEWIKSMDCSILKSLHIQDNDYAKKDFHRLPYGGSIDWDEVCFALAEKGYDGDLTLEVFGFLQNQDSRLLEFSLKYAEQVGRVLIDKIKEKNCINTHKGL